MAPRLGLQDMYAISGRSASGLFRQLTAHGMIVKAQFGYRVYKATV